MVQCYSLKTHKVRHVPGRHSSAVIAETAEQYPAYSKNFETWSKQSSAIAQQNGAWESIWYWRLDALTGTSLARFGRGRANGRRLPAALLPGPPDFAGRMGDSYRMGYDWSDALRGGHSATLGQDLQAGRRPGALHRIRVYRQSLGIA